MDDSSKLARNALVYLELLNIVTRRARQEFSDQEFASSLQTLHSTMPVSSFDIELLLTQAAQSQRNEPALSAAAAEAALLLVQWIDNPDLKLLVHRALGPAESYAEAARRYLDQGRPDLAVSALYNLGVSALNEGDSVAAEMSLREAWDLVQSIEHGDEYLPRSAVYDPEVVGVQVAESLARALVRLGKLKECLDIVDSAMESIARTTPRGSDSLLPRDEVAIGWVRLLTHAAHCESELRGLAAADEPLTEAKRIADAFDSPLASATARVSLSVAASKRADWRRNLELLGEARQFADRHRRSFPYELDKTKASNDTQHAYVWAAERLIDEARPWEALAVMEALRSRALLDMLGLAPAISLPETIPADLLQDGANALESLRLITRPGGGEAWGLGAVWKRRLRHLDEWLDRIEQYDHHDYAAIVRGASATASTLEQWTKATPRPIAVITWFLGDRYSFTVAATAGRPPSFLRTDLTLPWLHERAAEFRGFVGERRDPPPRLLAALSRALLEPIRDVIHEVDVVYVCPTQELHTIPLGALDVDGAPLAAQKNVGIVPTISVLRVLQSIDRTNRPTGGAVVFGPDFPDHAATVAGFLRAPLAPSLREPGLQAPAAEVSACSILHMICHGHWDERDPWASGFSFGHEVLTGRELLQWRLQARMATAEACDTHRGFITATEDSYGLARFFHLIGIPSVLLSDWEVRADVSLEFVKALYRTLLVSGEVAGREIGRGRAYRAAVKTVFESVGREHPFLWAPFTLVGIAD